METNGFNFWSLIVQICAAVATSIFAFWQIKINNRLKKLQDYIAITIVPAGFGSKINIMNVGKINVYLQKYQIGSNSESFAKPLLIPAGSNSFLTLTIDVFTPKNPLPATLYLIDEQGEKIISTGEVIIDNVQFVQQQAPSLLQGDLSVNTQQVVKTTTVVSAKSYKTVKKNWEL